jgi:hypothetical protein
MLRYWNVPEMPHVQLKNHRWAVILQQKIQRNRVMPCNAVHSLAQPLIAGKLHGEQCYSLDQSAGIKRLH